ncbi:MAG TPA: OmpA family protein [Flavitalea sp.]|nr:OmpA family protein [Flavitalea sp.]
MKTIQRLSLIVVAVSMILGGCKNLSKTQKGAGIGTAAGAAMGAVIGRAAGNTALGAIIGATVGGVTGAVIGRKMDKQAEEMKKSLPNAKVERIGEGIVVEFESKVLFAIDQANLNNSARTNLNDLSAILKKYPDTNIEVQGHTDNTGTDSHNQELSEKRAESVAQFLRNSGVASGRVTIKGFGETAPGYTNDTEEGRAQNRRVDFLITANEKMIQDAKKESEKSGK